jgi:hypothetical protein
MGPEAETIAVVAVLLLEAVAVGGLMRVEVD